MPTLDHHPHRATPSAEDVRQLHRWRNAIFVVFAVCGISLASWVSRLPTVRDALDADTAQMGWLIFSLSVGSIIGLLGASHILARLGARGTLRVFMTLSSIGLFVAALGTSIGPSYLLILLGLAVFGVGFSICDVTMNVSGAANEQRLGTNLMPLFHASFSGGTMLGAGLGWLAEVTGVPLFIHITVIAVAMTATVLYASRAIPRESSHGIIPTTTAGVAIAGVEPPDTWRTRLASWRNPRILLIGLIVLGMAFAEGTADDWLSLAAVDGHGLSKANGALVFGIFVTAMTIGRILGVRVLSRFGRVPVLRASALSALVGMLMFIFIPVPQLAVVGVIFWGLGAALGFPVGMSAAADDPKNAAANVSVVATIGYCAFLIGPPLIGALGHAFGLLYALLAVVLMVIVSGIASSAAREPQRRESPVGGGTLE